MSRNNDGRDWMAILAVLFALFIAINAISYFWFPFLPWFEQREAGQEILKEQNDAGKTLETYREFRQLYNDIEAQRNQIEIAYEAEEQFHETYGDDPEEWSREAEVRHGRIHERITGNRNMLERMVADYNAMSDDATQAAFKCHLPYKVDERFAIAGPPGSGEADQPQDVGPDGEAVNGEVPSAEECDGLPSKVEGST